MHMYERIHPVNNGTTMQTGNVYKAGNGIPHVVQVRCHASREPRARPDLPIFF